MSAAEASFRAGDLLRALEHLQNEVRQKPSDTKLRIFLAQLLMVLGQWDRALTQLNIIADMERFLSDWIQQYVLANPATVGEDMKARKPLAGAEVKVEEIEGNPGYYAAKFHLRPHYQLEGVTVSLSLVSRLPSQRGG
jgi:predicted component of type VI protein secretion system